MEQITNKEILEKLDKLQIDVNIIKENIHEEDSQLTEEEEKLLEESYENETSGKLISSSNLKEELGI